MNYAQGRSDGCGRPCLHTSPYLALKILYIFSTFIYYLFQIDNNIVFITHHIYLFLDFILSTSSIVFEKKNIFWDILFQIDNIAVSIIPTSLCFVFSIPFSLWVGRQGIRGVADTTNSTIGGPCTPHTPSYGPGYAMQLKQPTRVISLQKTFSWR